MNMAATLPIENQEYFDESFKNLDKPLRRLYNEAKNKFPMSTKPFKLELTDSGSVFSSALTAEEIDLVAIELETPTNWVDQSLEELEEIYNECSEKNWDGYGADKISREVYFEVTKLLNLIPTSFPIPEIAPEPDGGIGLEWYKDKGQTFIISVDGRKVITFAGLFGEYSEVHGTETFTNSMPTFIFDHLNRLFSD